MSPSACPSRVIYYIASWKETLASHYRGLTNSVRLLDSPPDPVAAAGVIGRPAPGFFLKKSFDAPQAFWPCVCVSFLYA